MLQLDSVSSRLIFDNPLMALKYVMLKQRDQPDRRRWSLFAKSFILKKLISQAIEPEASLEFPGLLLYLEKDYAFSSAFPFPSGLSCASFPIPSGVSRIDSLL